LREKIVDSAKRGEGNICYIGEPSDKASGDFGRNPLWAGTVLANAGDGDVSLDKPRSQPFSQNRDSAA
jgi:hypothetical protein